MLDAEMRPNINGRKHETEKGQKDKLLKLGLVRNTVPIYLKKFLTQRVKFHLFHCLTLTDDTRQLLQTFHLIIC